jgi:hypothetical protein
MVVAVADPTGQILVGMKAIAGHSQLSEGTLLVLIRDHRFPAEKTRGTRGTWISSTEAINRWALEFCTKGETDP